jgi:hypothetical protein
MKKLALIFLLIPSILKSQSTLETEFLKQLNSYRDSLGLSKLEYDSNLSLASNHFLTYELKVGNIVKHVESIDFPNFTEISTPEERVLKLTNFNLAKRLIKDSLGTKTFVGDEVTAGSKTLPRFVKFAGKGKTLKSSDGSEYVTTGDTCKDLSFLILKSLKDSKGHNLAITDPGKSGMKVGISFREGILVMVYGYRK